MPFAVDLLGNAAYGYPRGAERRIAPTKLAVLHITANPNTPPATAKQERDYANRAGSEGPSAHTYVDRPGGGVHAVETRYAAWSNGVLRSPKTAVSGVSDIVAMPAAGLNPNEAYVREIELCGRYSEYPVTLAQRDEAARLIASDSIAWRIPIARDTVHLHSDLDTVQRPNCPVPAAQAEAFAADIIGRARQYAQMDIDALLEELRRQVELLRQGKADAEASRDLALAERDVLAGKIAAAVEALS